MSVSFFAKDGIRVQHKLFKETGTVIGVWGKPKDNRVYVRWDNPGNMLDYCIGTWNLIFRVKAPSRPHQS